MVNDPTSSKFSEMYAKYKELDTESDKEVKKKYKEDYSGFYVFFSFDIVNSTLYKSIDSNWPNVITDFYEQAISSVKFNFDSSTIFLPWKFIGDEVIFFGIIRNTMDLLYVPTKVNLTMRQINDSIHKNYPESKGLLNIKSTIWCANVEQMKDEGDHPIGKGVNYLYTNTNKDSQYSVGEYDFFGSEIDAGFRLAKNCAKKNQVLVSTELVYIILSLAEKTESNDERIKITSKYKIMNFEKLKGIWHGRKYPVIWYREQWEEDVSDYDDDDDFDFYKTYYQQKDASTLVYLDKVLRDVGKKEIVLSCIDIIKDSSEDGARISATTQYINHFAEIHLAMIIFDNNYNILLMKRGINKSKPGKYDFGCVNLTISKKVDEELLGYYSNFLTDERSITIVKDEVGEPTPLGIYNYTRKNGRNANGIIFCAKYDGIFNLSAINRYDGYEEFCIESVDKINSGNIDLFKGSVERINKAKELLDLDSQ
ncbi:hypothetical protein BG261_08625 [Floricoccus tropicus]|uniref:Uncharacterized protein n=1 Tax=Floricoccus tropicus TaxID=1859473 RepID=A0A1E8GK51_9LACT|nr:hypothetical protein [Floricoccus tropicus]OFI48336.1 hypothetical protein BG261_08625 [Floricoccus tropicus]